MSLDEEFERLTKTTKKEYHEIFLKDGLVALQKRQTELLELSKRLSGKFYKRKIRTIHRRLVMIAGVIVKYDASTGKQCAQL